jgi:hypothetical protein
MKIGDINLPRLESLLKSAAIVVWTFAGVGWGLFGLIESNPAHATQQTLSGIALGMACWGASTVLPDLFALFKINIAPPQTPRPPGT